MKVLIVNTYDSGGGAALAAMRLADALRNEGAQVRILVAVKQSDRDDIAQMATSPLAKLRHRMAFYAERLGIYLHNGFDRSQLFQVSTACFGTDISQHPWVKDWADVIHLHWINQGFVSIKGLARLAMIHKPVVWTMHDMWLATAICHHARQCTHYCTDRGCGSCPRIGSKQEKDLSTRIAYRKAQALQLLQPTIVGCSKWIADTARRSIYTSDLRITDIPNPIDTSIFSPTEKGAARHALHLPTNKFLLLFGAVQADNKRKGIDQMASALSILHKQHPTLRSRLALVVFGRLSDQAAQALSSFDIHRVGYIGSATQMAQLYNTADAFVTPSLEENLPNTIMESLSCGTPCIGFDIGGIPEMIIDGHNGYIAQYASADSLADRILKLIHLNEDAEATASMRKASRESAVARYDRHHIAHRFLALYADLCP